MLHHIDGEILNDEVVIIHSSGSVGKPEVFEPYTEIRLSSILGDVGRRSEALWERRSLDVSAKGLGSRAIWARTPVIGSATMPRLRLTSPVDGLAGAHAAYSHRRLVDVIVIPGLT